MANLLRRNKYNGGNGFGLEAMRPALVDGHADHIRCRWRRDFQVARPPEPRCKYVGVCRAESR